MPTYRFLYKSSSRPFPFPQLTTNNASLIAPAINLFSDKVTSLLITESTIIIIGSGASLRKERAAGTRRMSFPSTSRDVIEPQD